MSTETKEKLTPPPVLWAQTKKEILLLVNLEDCVNPVIELTNDKLYFRGIGGTEKKEHEISIEFLHEIDSDKSKYHIIGRGVDFNLIKLNSNASFWSRLLKDNSKPHWLKVDFTRYRDESDDDDEEPVDKGDFEDMLRKMDGLGAGEEKFNDEDLDKDDKDHSDSDDDLPDLED